MFKKNKIIYKISACILIVSLVFSHPYQQIFADTDEVKTSVNEAKERLWYTSFEDGETTLNSFYSNTADKKIGTKNVMQNVTSNLVGDITNLIDQDMIGGSSDHQSSESKTKLFDGNQDTKFLNSSGCPVSVVWDLKNSEKKAVNSYAIYAANDASERDPKDWKFQAYDRDNKTWITLDEQKDQIFTNRYDIKQYEFENDKAYSKFRLYVSKNRGNVAMTQWSELMFATGNEEDNSNLEEKMISKIGTGPSYTWCNAANKGWSGQKALEVSGTHYGKKEAWAANILFNNLSIPVGDHTYLSYTLFPALLKESDYDYEYTQMHMMIDLKFKDGTYLSDLSAKDQYGTEMTPQKQGQSRILMTNQWNQVTSNIGKAAQGKVIEQVLVYYKKDANNRDKAAHFKTFFDDIELYNNTEALYADKADYVNILRGTNSTTTFSRGLTAPSVNRPHGFNFYTPATNFDSDVIYEYQHNNLRYITVSHEPSIWINDRGTWQFMVNTSLDASAGSFNMKDMEAAFSHEDEIAKAHYYSVEFDQTKGAAAGSKLELTPTSHGAVVRFTFDADNTNKNVLLDCVRANGGLTIQSNQKSFTAYSDHTSIGSKKMYVYGEFNKTPVSSKINGKQGIVRFEDQVVEMKIATSYISYEQAKKNLQLEMESKTFDEVFAEAKTEWNDKLNVIDNVKGASKEELITVYSNLYRLFSFPNTMSENTGTNENPVWKYKSPYRDQSADPVDGSIYINNGFWDTYRTSWSAYALFTPNTDTELLNGLIQHYKDQSWIPRWIAPGGKDSMVGTSSDIILADAMLKGVEFDYINGYQSALRNGASVTDNMESGGRKDLNTSIFNGYTAGGGERLSWSLEGYVNDFGIANMAKYLASQENDEKQREIYEAEYAYYNNRSKNYINLFYNGGESVTDKWFRGRELNGDWTSDNNTEGVFDPYFWGSDFTETNAFNMAVSVVHDGQGLANLYGGREKLAEKLDSIFETNGIYNGYGAQNSIGGIHEQREGREVKLGQYGHHNQPSHHIPYMYNYAGQPWKTQAYVRDILSRCYTGATFGQGYIGDEDNGEMSAWYLLSMLGIYPLKVGTDEYAIGSPLFEEVTVNMENGKQLVVKADNNSKENVYVQSLKVNGKAYNKSYLKHSDIANGGILEFTMGSKPNTKWASDSDALPSSLTKEDEEVTVYQDLILKNNTVANGDVNSTSKVTENTIFADFSGVNALIDNDSKTEAAFGKTTNTIKYSLAEKREVQLFTISSPTSAKAPEKVIVYGALDGGEWVEIASYDNLKFDWKWYTRPYEIQNKDYYSHYKVVMTGGSGLAEIELLGLDQAEELVTVSAAIKAGSGTVTPNKSIIRKGKDQNITIKANTDYNLTKVVVGGQNYDLNKLVKNKDGSVTLGLKSVIKDTTVEVYFTKIPKYKLSLSKISKGSIQITNHKNLNEILKGTQLTAVVKPGKDKEVTAAVLKTSAGQVKISNIKKGSNGTYILKFTMPASNATLNVSTKYKVPSTGKKVYYGNYQYKVLSSKSRTVTLVKPKKKSYKKIVVPSEIKINGYKFKVTTISKKAFYKNKKLHTVTIGKNVTTIKTQAFASCTKLKNIKFSGKNVKKVEKNAFQKIYKKAVIKVPKTKLAKYKKIMKSSKISKSVRITK